MGRPRTVRPNWDELATIWTASDALWEVIQPILAELDPPKQTGRPRVDARRTLDAIIFRMGSGREWNQLPERFPDDSSVHRTFQRWVRVGVFARIWATLVDHCAELGAWSGSGNRRIPCWAKRGWGGPHWPQSHRSRQTGREAQPAGRGDRRPTGRRDRGRQRA